MKDYVQDLLWEEDDVEFEVFRTENFLFESLTLEGLDG